MPFPLQRTLDPLIEPVSLADMKLYLRVDIDDDDALIQSLISVARERAEDMTGRCLIAQQWTFCMDHFPTWRNYDDTQAGYLSDNWSLHRTMFKRSFMDIVMPRGPLLSINSITYKDMNGVTQTLAPSGYEIDQLSDPARITPSYSGWWPAALWDTNSVQISFTAGYQQTVNSETLKVATTVVNGSPVYTATLQRSATAIELVTCTDSTTNLPMAATLANGVVTLTGMTPATANDVIVVSYVVTSIPQSFIHAIKLICSTYYENRAEVVQGGGNFNSLPVPFGASALLDTYKLFQFGYPEG